MKKYTALELFDNLNHDIKSPIASILSVISILGMDKKWSTQQITEYHQKISDKLHFLNSSVDTLYDLVFLQEDRIVLYPEFISLTELIQIQINRLPKKIAPTFKVKSPSKNEELLVVGDRQRLQQVFNTVFGVITRLQEQGSTTVVELKTLKKQVKVEMIFVGEQIPETDEKKLFTLDYLFGIQHEKKIYPSLFVAAELTKLHKGSLTYHRTDDHSGSFVLELPLKS